MAKLISQLCGELQLAVCLPRGYTVIGRRPEHLCISEKPQKQATAKAAQTTFSINTCLNCQSMCTAIVWCEKCVLLCAWKPDFSNLVTNSLWIEIAVNCMQASVFFPEIQMLQIIIIDFSKYLKCFSQIQSHLYKRMYLKYILL